MNTNETFREGPQCVSSALPAASKSNAKILLVEDEADFSDSVSRILREAGHQVTAVENGDEACRAMDEAAPDLILSDIDMPGLNGLGLLRRVRVDPSLASTPVVFLTALAGNSHRRAAMDLGADDFLNKPVERKALLQAVESRLRRARDFRDECQARLRRQKDFVSLIAHDLRAPLTAFSLGLDLSELRFRGDDLIPFDTMENAVESMNGMVDRLLRMARCHGEGIPFEPKPVALAALCERAAELVKGYRSAHHALDIRVAPGASASVDPVIVEQVLVNLISNAFKYSPAGGLVTLTVTAGEKELRFEVADQGTGMSPNDIENLFSSFHRSPRHRHLAGNGVGLFGTKLLVERHGGRIECRSVLGVGTRFTVTLPAGSPSENSN